MIGHELLWTVMIDHSWMAMNYCEQLWLTIHDWPWTIVNSCHHSWLAMNYCEQCDWPFMIGHELLRTVVINHSWMAMNYCEQLQSFMNGHGLLWTIEIFHDWPCTTHNIYRSWLFMNHHGQPKNDWGFMGGKFSMWGVTMRGTMSSWHIRMACFEGCQEPEWVPY